MGKYIRRLSALLWLFIASAHAAPINVSNFSFETPVLGIGGFTNTISPWLQSGASGQSFIEYIADTLRSDTPGVGNNRQYIGVALNNNVFLNIVDTAAAAVNYDAATEYTLRAGVGWRSGQTNATLNQSVVFLTDATTTSTALVTPALNNTAATGAAFNVRVTDLTAVGTFVDGPPIVINTTANPGLVGKQIRVQVRAFGSGRSHFDNIRLSKTTGGVVTHGTPLPLAFTATVPVTITDNGDSASFSGTLYYGLADGGTTPGSWTNSVPLGNNLAKNAVINAALSSLTPGTVYFFRARGTNFAGDAWASSTGTFTTAIPAAATLQNNAATAIGTHAATLNGQVLTNGGDVPVITMFWGTTDGDMDPAMWTSSASLGPKDVGTFSNTITGLLHSTTYYFRSRAVNASGPSWSPTTLSFTTVTVTPPSSLVTVAPIGTTGYTALLNGLVTDPGNEAPDVTVYWGPTDGDTVPANWANSVTYPSVSAAFGHLANNLSPSSVYYWRARSVNTNGTSWSPATITFTTNTKLPVFLNEVHYDPDNHTQRLEFIELWNPSTTPVDISGWRLTGPADFTFPPSTLIGAGAYLVVAENPAALNTAYTVPGALGPWVGVLKNSAGHIVLRNPATTQVDDVDYQKGFPWPTAAAGAGSSMELINPGLENDVGGSWRSSKPISPSTLPLPTPGRLNSQYSAIAPPTVSNVDYAAVAVPAQGLIVKSTQDVKITAYVDDRNGVSGVTLQYQIIDPGAYIPRYLQPATPTFTPALNPAYNTGWVSLPMVDNATGGDAIAADKTYTVTLPGSLSVHRRLIRYRIVATDILTTSVQVPYSDDESPNFGYFIYDGCPAWSGAFRPASITTPVVGSTAVQTFPASLINSIEPYHLIATDADVINCQYNNAASLDRPFAGTFVYKGKVYDNIFFKNRGIGSTYNTGKNKWAIKFNRARDFQAYDNWGRPYNQQWNSLSLDANAYPWAAVFRGAAGIEEASSYRAHELAGNTSLRTTYSQLRVIRRAAESNPAGTLLTESLGTNFDGQYSTDLFGLYMSLEPTEGNLLDERNLPDSNIYAIEGNGGDLKYQAANLPTGTDWANFGSTSTTNANGMLFTGQTEEWYRANMDLPALYNFMGLGRLMGNVDVRPGDNYRFIHRSSDNRWEIMAYDLDMMYIAGHHWGGTIDGVAIAAAPNAIVAIKRHPAIAMEYRNRCRELLSLLTTDASVNGGQIGQLLDEYAQMVNPTGVALTWADLDAAMWNFHPRTLGNSAASGQNNARANFFRATFSDGTRGGLGGTNQTATWLRQIPDPDVDGIGDHEGFVQWFTNYATNTYPASTTWTRRATSAGPFFAGAGADTSTDRQKGFGYKYLEWESLHGGYLNTTTNPPAATAVGDLTGPGIDRYYAGDSLATLAAGSYVLYPNKPALTFTGSPGFPVNGLQFTSSDYTAPTGGGAIAAVQYRIGEISAPGIPLYDPTQPRVYELEGVWTSAEIPTASPTGIAPATVPVIAIRAGHTYRARVRHKDATGRWSFWSDPVQFVAGTPELAGYISALRVSEVNYNPGPVTAAELATPGWNISWTEQDFEFLEVTNVSSLPVDMTDVRFTKGVDFNFAPAYIIPANTSVVLTKNPAAFAIRYGSTPMLVPGSFTTDNLRNSGEEVKLSYGAGNQIISFTYLPVAPWPVSPAGNGPTLVLIDPWKPLLDHNVPAEWRASCLPGGSPGARDSNSYNYWARVTWPGTAGMGADDDLDGLDNRLEYALGTNPGSNSQQRVPTAAFESGYATLTYTHPPDTKDVTYRVQFSDELMAWTLPAIKTGSTLNGDGSITEVWRSADPVNIKSRIFGRVQITAP